MHSLVLKDEVAEKIACHILLLRSRPNYVQPATNAMPRRYDTIAGPNYAFNANTPRSGVTVTKTAANDAKTSTSNASLRSRG